MSNTIGTITLYPEIAPINMLLFKKHNLSLINYRSYEWPSNPPVEAFKADVLGAEDDFNRCQSDIHSMYNLYELILDSVFSDNFTLENATTQLTELVEKVRLELSKA